jgi:outer membrane protein
MEDMMRKIAAVLFAGIFVLCATISIALAQESAAASAQKIGVVDIYKAVNDSEQGKKAKAELESMIKSKQSALESKGRAIEKLRSEIEQQGDVLSADAKKNKAEEYERLTREYQRNMTDSQNEVRKKESELTGRIIKKVGEIVIGLGQEGKYTLILEKQQILFADSSLDLTDTVINRLDSTSSSSSSTSKPRKKK